MLYNLLVGLGGLRGAIIADILEQCQGVEKRPAATLDRASLASRFNTTRNNVRNAISRLVDDGFIEAIDGGYRALNRNTSVAVAATQTATRRLRSRNTAVAETATRVLPNRNACVAPSYKEKENSEEKTPLPPEGAGEGVAPSRWDSLGVAAQRDLTGHIARLTMNAYQRHFIVTAVNCGDDVACLKEAVRLAAERAAGLPGWPWVRNVAARLMREGWTPPTHNAPTPAESAPVEYTVASEEERASMARYTRRPAS